MRIPRGWLKNYVVLMLAYASVGGIVLVLNGPGLHGAAIWLVASLSTGVLMQRLAWRSEQLVAQDRHFEAVIDHTTVGILLVERSGDIGLANSAASAIFGLPVEQIEGRTVEAVLQSLGIDTRTTVLAPAKRGGASDPMMIKTPSGIARWVRLRMSDLPEATRQRSAVVIVTDVTESVETTRRIAEAEHRWNQALEGSQIGVYESDLLTGSGVVSDTWRRLVGFSANETIDPETEWARRIHPDDLARVRQADLDCIEGRAEHVVVEYRFRVADGRWRWMRSDAKVVERTEDGRAQRLLGTMTDITDLRHAIELARTREVEMKDLIEQSPVAKAVIGIDGRFELVNDAFCEFIGHPRAELECALLTDVPAAGEFLRDRRKFKELMAGTISSFSAEARYVRRDGSERFGLITATRLRAKPEAGPRFVVQIVDVTEARRLARLRADFVATVSHELRTPLTSITGAIKAIVGTMPEQLPEKALRLLTVASRNCDRLGQLVNDLLDMQRLVAGGADFQFMAANIPELVQQCLLEATVYADQYGVTFNPLEADESLGAEVDVNRFKQAMDNLFSNAAKFSPRGGTVTTQIHREGSAVVITITNGGPGIPMEIGDRVFEPFTQAEDTDTRHHEGSGLGLSIAKSIVERLQGQIGFTSTQGATTTFWIKLPMAKDAARDAA